MPGIEDLSPKPPPGKVNVKLADGTPGTVDASQVEDVLDNQGEVVTPAQIAEAKERAQYSTPGMEALAAAGGAASTLSLGLSDEAGAALGGEDFIKAQKYNPNARLLGEAAGFAAPWGAESLAERTGVEGLEALGGAPALLNRGGRAVESAVGAGLEAISPEASRALGTKILASSLEQGAGVGLEGSLYGLGQSISDDALDPEQNNLTAEKVLANMEKGALFAGGLGAASGALVPAGKSLARYLGVESGLGEYAQKKAGEIAWRSAGGTKAMARGADRFANGPAEIGKIWIDEAPELAGESAFRDMSREKLADAAVKGQAKYGSMLNEQVGKIDEMAAAENALPKAADISAEMQSKVADLASHAGTGAAQHSLQSFINDFNKISGLTDAEGQIINPDARVTFSQLRAFRRDADAKWAGNSVDPHLFGFKKDFHDIRTMLENRVEQGGQAIAARAGEDFADAYKTTKARYQAFKLLGKAAESGAAASASNNLLGLNARMAANAGAIAGSVLGHIPGAAIGGAIGAAGGHFIQHHGDFLAADLLNQIGHLKSIAAKSADTDMRILGAASSFVHSAEMTRSAKPSLMGREEYQQVATALRSAQRDPSLLEDRLSQMTRPMLQAAPQTAQAVSTKATAGVMFLASKLPTAHGDGNLLQPGKGMREAIPGHLEIETFQRYLRAFEDPESVLDDMRAGRITREGVETVRVNYPGLYQQMQQELMVSAADPKSPELRYDKLVQLGVMFGIPTTEFLQPDIFQTMQTNFSTPAANAGPEQMPQLSPLPNTTKRPLQLDTDNLKTQAQEALAR